MGASWGITKLSAVKLAPKFRVAGVAEAGVRAQFAAIALGPYVHAITQAMFRTVRNRLCLFEIFMLVAAHSDKETRTLATVKSYEHQAFLSLSAAVC